VKHGPRRKRSDVSQSRKPRALRRLRDEDIVSVSIGDEGGDEVVGGFAIALGALRAAFMTGGAQQTPRLMDEEIVSGPPARGSGPISQGGLGRGWEDSTMLLLGQDDGGSGTFASGVEVDR